jgi:hypothetical protein
VHFAFGEGSLLVPARRVTSHALSRPRQPRISAGSGPCFFLVAFEDVAVVFYILVSLVWRPFAQRSGSSSSSSGMQQQRTTTRSGVPPLLSPSS